VNPRKEFMENVLQEVGLLKKNEDVPYDLQLVEEKDE
jgi:hypothetical protein